MALKTVLDSLEGVDDALKPLYAEDGERFVLQLDGVDSHPQVANLKSAYERVKADKEKATGERDAFKAKVADLPDDFDADVWRRAKEGKADPEQLAKLRSALEGERDEVQAKYDALVASNQQRAVRDAVSTALADQGVPEELRKGASLQMLEGRKVEMNGETPVIETDMGPMGLADYAKAWVGKEGKAFVAPPQGGGSRGKDTTPPARKPGDLAGSRDDRVAAINARFPDLAGS